ncbi:titin-like [Ornithodoros turicata]|uniref:titin-like n=1 Tax=Ornithodoros turicata TaxID=34597 RepID=UPI00313A1BC8
MASRKVNKALATSKMKPVIALAPPGEDDTTVTSMLLRIPKKSRPKQTDTSRARPAACPECSAVPVAREQAETVHRICQAVRSVSDTAIACSSRVTRYCRTCGSPVTYPDSSPLKIRNIYDRSLRPGHDHPFHELCSRCGSLTVSPSQQDPPPLRAMDDSASDTLSWSLMKIQDGIQMFTNLASAMSNKESCEAMQLPGNVGCPLLHSNSRRVSSEESEDVIYVEARDRRKSARMMRAASITDIKHSDEAPMTYIASCVTQRSSSSRKAAEGPEEYLPVQSYALQRPRVERIRATSVATADLDKSPSQLAHTARLEAFQEVIGQPSLPATGSSRMHPPGYERDFVPKVVGSHGPEVSKSDSEITVNIRIVYKGSQESLASAASSVRARSTDEGASSIKELKPSMRHEGVLAEQAVKLPRHRVEPEEPCVKKPSRRRASEEKGKKEVLEDEEKLSSEFKRETKEEKQKTTGAEHPEGAKQKPASKRKMSKGKHRTELSEASTIEETETSGAIRGRRKDSTKGDAVKASKSTRDVSEDDLKGKGKARPRRKRRASVSRKRKSAGESSAMSTLESLTTESQSAKISKDKDVSKEKGESSEQQPTKGGSKEKLGKSKKKGQEIDKTENLPSKPTDASAEKKSDESKEKPRKSRRKSKQTELMLSQPVESKPPEKKAEESSEKKADETKLKDSSLAKPVEGTPKEQKTQETDKPHPLRRRSVQIDVGADECMTSAMQTDITVAGPTLRRESKGSVDSTSPRRRRRSLARMRRRCKSISSASGTSLTSSKSSEDVSSKESVSSETPQKEEKKKTPKKEDRKKAVPPSEDKTNGKRKGKPLAVVAKEERRSPRPEVSPQAKPVKRDVMQHGKGKMAQMIQSPLTKPGQPISPWTMVPPMWDENAQLLANKSMMMEKIGQAQQQNMALSQFKPLVQPVARDFTTPVPQPVSQQLPQPWPHPGTPALKSTASKRTVDVSLIIEKAVPSTKHAIDTKAIEPDSRNEAPAAQPDVPTKAAQDNIKLPSKTIDSETGVTIKKPVAEPTREYQVLDASVEGVEAEKQGPLRQATQASTTDQPRRQAIQASTTDQPRRQAIQASTTDQPRRQSIPKDTEAVKDGRPQSTAASKPFDATSATAGHPSDTHDKKSIESIVIEEMEVLTAELSHKLQTLKHERKKTKGKKQVSNNSQARAIPVGGVSLAKETAPSGGPEDESPDHSPQRSHLSALPGHDRPETEQSQPATNRNASRGPRK